jgi:hypothetical protein
LPPSCMSIGRRVSKTSSTSSFIDSIMQSHRFWGQWPTSDRSTLI